MSETFESLITSVLGSSLSIPDAMENSVKALKLAIKCHMEQTKVDFPAVRYSFSRGILLLPMEQKF